MIRVVCGCVVRGDRVFVARRGPGSKHAGCWEFPGGKVDPGEDDVTALRRELLEELAWPVEVGAWVGEGDTGPIRLVGYFCRAAGEPVLSEHDEARWLLPQELASLHWAPADAPVVAALLKAWPAER